MTGVGPLLIPFGVFVLVWIVAAAFTKKTVRSVSMREQSPHAIAAIISAVLLLTLLGRVAPSMLTRFIPSTPVTRAFAYVCAYAGIAFAIWARFTLGSLWSGTITLKEDHRLVQSGPFAITRHPIYSGLLLACLGLTIFLGSLHALLAYAILAAAFAFKANTEETLMRETFGDEHRAYTARVHMLIPYVW